MQPLIEKSPAYLARWIEKQGVDPSLLARVVEGIDISARREVPDLPGGQQPEVFIPGLTATPWWDAERFPWVASLEAASAGITAEFTAAGGLTGDNGVSLASGVAEAGLADRGRWTALYLYCIGKAYSKNIEMCPTTVGALTAIPGLTGTDGGMCYFSIMDPGTHVTAHTGYTNAHLRCHLALIAPSGCDFRVGDEIRQWEQGRVSVFDDSFDHEAWNNADSGRAVLLFDIWHPELTELEVRALAYMSGVWRRLLARSFWTRELVGAQAPQPGR